MTHTDPFPTAYFITCRTYGTWLHGDKRESVDRYHNVYGTKKIAQNTNLEHCMKTRRREEAFVLNASERITVLKSIMDTCHYYDWFLYSAHVRTNHMHIVLSAALAPEKVAASLKSYASRYLNKNNLLSNRKHIWSRGASTRYIYDSENIFRVIQCTMEEQGLEMAAYCHPDYRS